MKPRLFKRVHNHVMEISGIMREYRKLSWKPRCRKDPHPTTLNFASVRSQLCILKCYVIRGQFSGLVHSDWQEISSQRFYATPLVTPVVDRKSSEAKISRQVPSRRPHNKELQTHNAITLREGVSRQRRQNQLVRKTLVLFVTSQHPCSRIATVDLRYDYLCSFGTS